MVSNIEAPGAIAGEFCPGQSGLRRWSKSGKNASSMNEANPGGPFTR